MTDHPYDLIIVGAGPAGLSCATEALKAGLTVLVLEQGSVVDAIRRFPTDLIWFSTPELLEIGNVPFTISTTRPTRVDTLNYYRAVANRYAIDIRSFDAVTEVRREPDCFHVHTSRGRRYLAEHVVIATGYFDTPSRLNVQGEDLPNVSHYYREPFEFAGCSVTVVGGRNSAVEAALDLYRHGARVSLVHRGPRLSEGVKYWILPDIENRLKNKEIQGIFESTVHEIRPDSLLLHTPGGQRELSRDFTFVLIGFQPDVEHLRAWGVQLDPETLAPKVDPATFETDVRGLFVAGSVVAGKNTNKIFVENGRLHGQAIVSAILRRRQG